VLALAGVAGVSGQATGTGAPSTPSPTAAVPTATPQSTAARSFGAPSDFGIGIVNPSTLPSMPVSPIATGTTSVLPRAGTIGNVMSGPMTTTSMMPRTGMIPPMSAFQGQFGLQTGPAFAQGQFMNGNFGGGFFYNPQSMLPPYMFNGMKPAYGLSSPLVSSPMVSSPMPSSSMVSSPVQTAPVSTGTSSFNFGNYQPTGISSAGVYQTANGPVYVSAPTYGTPTMSSNSASVQAALAAVSNVPGIGSPVNGLPAGATNLGPSSLIPGAFISGISYGAAQY